MTANDTWFIEHFDHTGSAIGFRITARLDQVQSPFQKIEIYDSTDWGKLMVIDGAMMLTTRDNFFYHEMIAHPVLFTHPRHQPVKMQTGNHATRRFIQRQVRDHRHAAQKCRREMLAQFRH